MPLPQRRSGPKRHSLPRPVGYKAQAGRHAQALAACTSGQTALLSALLLIPLLGAAGMALDIGQWILWRRQLHTAADLAALAGARALATNTSATAAVSRALANNATRAYTVKAIETPPTSGAWMGDANAVRVILQTQQALPFSSIFLKAPPVITVAATALGQGQTPNCLIALDRTTATGIAISGNSTLAMNCGAMSNTAGLASLDASASGVTVDVAALSAAGKVLAGTGTSTSTKVNNGLAQVDDPFAGLTIPVDAANCAADPPPLAGKQVATLYPGCYPGLDIQGDVTLSPGTYYIDSGSVNVGATASLVGDGVTLVFTSSTGVYGGFRANGSALVSLGAPSSGPYRGVALFQDRRATPSSTTNFLVQGNTLKVNGVRVASFLRGAIYTPGSYVTFTGNTAFSTDCMQIVAARILLTGNTKVTNVCPDGTGASALKATSIRLVE